MVGKSALVVDDERLIALLLARLAESCGLRADVAYNGREALERMRAGKPDLLLLDLIMPVMSGEELLAAMHSDPELEGVPVIVVSTRPPVSTAGTRALAHVRKPFEPAELKRLIAEALDLMPA